MWNYAALRSHLDHHGSLVDVPSTAVADALGIAAAKNDHALLAWASFELARRGCDRRLFASVAPR